MACAVGASGTSPNIVSDEERRWVVVGICLNKVLTPALRDILAKEMPLWYQRLLPPPDEIDKQTLKSHKKSFRPSTLKLNYESINNNFALHKSSYRNYDYAVKDPVSLAKLFMKHFMASFTGFDQTMDTSAALSVVAEAQPFHASGTGGMAIKMRSDVRNEWAHCDFTHWTEVNYQSALTDIESLLKNINLTPAGRRRLIDELNGWKQKGLDLCFGQPLDSELLKLVNTEVAELRDSVKSWTENEECNKDKLLNALKTLKESLEQKIQDLEERQHRTEKKVDELKFEQLALCKAISRNNEKEPRYVFIAPKKTEWFSGRESELELLRDILENNTSCKDKVIVTAVSGLGGSGKTSLASEYTHKWKDHYPGGVCWISGEDDVKLKDSIDDIAAQFNTLHEKSLDATLSKTLAVFSRIRKPWLMVVDDMDELNLSPNLLKVVSGSWQANAACNGHLIITTRRKAPGLTENIPGFKEVNCLKLDCFSSEEGKSFVFKRTGIDCNEQTETVAGSLVQKLGRLPLALEQACAYIKYLGCTLSAYIESYEKQSLQLLNKKKATSVYATSPERLAVRTTWLLNFEHIRKNENGSIAVRFLNASAFMNPNEIQRELINIGEPRVGDEAYCNHVSTSLGSLEILKLLTDFSLFKETPNSSLSVHRLVQEVIRENLKAEEKVESIVDAARLLRFAFSNCPSPDVLSQSEVSENSERSSLRSTEFSCFYQWHKMCLHTYEIKKNLETYLDTLCEVKEKTFFLPEVARIVYECALHLNVNNFSSEAKTVVDFANRILDWGDNVISEPMVKTLFPHMFPLAESLRRLIQYSCSAPVETNKPITFEKPGNGVTTSSIETMRLNGNKDFREQNFEKAAQIYSSCINSSKDTDSFDPLLLSNRASAYLRMKQYKNALKDSEEYIEYSPKCWRGYAKKALALHGLSEKWDAVCAAALAFYRNPKIFNDFAPFEAAFPNLKQHIHICDDVSSLAALLSQLPCGNISDIPRKIIVLKQGEYRISADDFDMFRVKEDEMIKRLWIGSSILIGVGDSSPEQGVTLSFVGNFGVSTHNFMAVNISFVFNVGNWLAKSTVKVINCSFTTKNDKFALLSQGNLSVKKCQFVNCEGTALCVAGKAEIEDSIFYGNESVGLQCVPHGNLVLKNSKLYANQWGLDVKNGTCYLTGCQIYDNKKIGVGVGNGKVDLTRNEIFHNDRHGIYLCEKSYGFVKENEIFENGWWGIHTMSDAECHISRNKIFKNKCGGIHAVPISKISSDHRESVIEFNKIFCNGGPGIDQSFVFADEVGSPDPSMDMLPLGSEKDFKKAKCTENDVKDNIENVVPPPSQNVVDICFTCFKKGKLMKCTKCFTAGYCNAKCQKDDWKKHKTYCTGLLEKYSVLVKVLPKSVGLTGDKINLVWNGNNYNNLVHLLKPLGHSGDKINYVNHGNNIEVKAWPCPWLQPSGLQYAEPPEQGKRFVVKIQAGDTMRKSSLEGALLAIEDRSLTINGDLDKNEHSGLVHHLVRECGSNCEGVGWKKMFFWALLEKGNMVRVFIANFPPYQQW